MKKILFSLAALAALSLVAAGCKKPTDGANSNADTLQTKIYAVKNTFNAALKACGTNETECADNGIKASDVMAKCDALKKAVEELGKEKIDDKPLTDVCSAMLNGFDALIKKDALEKSNGLKNLRDALTAKKDEVDGLSKESLKAKVNPPADEKFALTVQGSATLNTNYKLLKGTEVYVSGTKVDKGTVITVKAVTAITIDGTEDVAAGIDKTFTLTGDKTITIEKKTPPTAAPALVKSNPVSVDNTAATKNKKITLTFDQAISYVTSQAVTKSKVKFSSDGRTFAGLAGNETVTVTGSTMVITLNAAITGATNKIKIEADAVKNNSNQNNIEITTGNIAAH